MNQEKEFLRSRMQSMSLQGALKIKGEFTVIWKKRGCSHISSAKFGGIQIPCQVGRFVDLHAIASCYSTHYCRGKAPSDTIAIAIRPDFVLGKKTDIIFFNHNQVSRFRDVWNQTPVHHFPTYIEARITGLGTIAHSTAGSSVTPTIDTASTLALSSAERK